MTAAAADPRSPGQPVDGGGEPAGRRPGDLSTVTRAEQLTDRITYHGEGAVWFPGPGRDGGILHLVDMLAGDVLTLLPDGGVHRRSVGTVAAVLRPRTGGGAVVADEHGFLVADADALDPSGLGQFRRLAQAVDDDTIRLNEGNADPAGAFYCGSMAWAKTAGRGTLYRLDPDGSVTTVLTGVTISNGLGFTPDGHTAYYVDTPTHRIDAFDWDAEHGLHDRRPFVAVDGNPDGLVVDAEGGVWVALFGGGAVHHYGPDGTLSEVVEIPGAEQVTSVTLGGPAMDRLFVTTSREDLPDDAWPAAGAVFTAPAGVRGQAPLPFRG